MSLFDDPEVEAIVTAGGMQKFGNRSIYVPRPFGFCGGVRQALRQLEAVTSSSSAAPTPPGRRLLLGSIIHNPNVNQHFARLGIEIIPEPEWPQAIANSDVADTIIIPAFGVSLELEPLLTAAAARGVRIIDTTCGYVKRIWAFVDQMAATANSIIIHGNATHQETLATVSRALAHKVAVVVVNDLASAQICAAAIAGNQPLPETPALRVFNRSVWQVRSCALTCQTTMLHSQTVTIAAILQQAINANAGTLHFGDTVCLATQQRQDAALNLCQQGLDLALVVGGFNSSNTTQLYRLARTYAPTYFIADATALAPELIRHYRPELQRQIQTPHWLTATATRIGIFAGASCPPRDIGAVLQWLRMHEAASGA